MNAMAVAGTQVLADQITVGDFTYAMDEAGNVRRWLCDHSTAWSCGSGCEAEKVLGEHDIPSQVLAHFGL